MGRGDAGNSSSEGMNWEVASLSSARRCLFTYTERNDADVEVGVGSMGDGRLRRMGSKDVSTLLGYVDKLVVRLIEDDRLEVRLDGILGMHQKVKPNITKKEKTEKPSPSFLALRELSFVEKFWDDASESHSDDVPLADDSNIRIPPKGRSNRSLNLSFSV